MKTDFSKATNYEIYNIVDTVLHIHLPNEDLNPLIASQLEALEAAFRPFTIALPRGSSASLGKSVQQIMQERDQFFTAWRRAIKAFAQMKRAQAESLALLIHKYNIDIHADKTNELSGKYNKLIEELEEAQYQTNLADLGMLNDFSTLKNLQKQYGTHVSEQKSFIADLKEQDSATKLRPTLNTTLSNFCKFVTSMRHINDDWQALYNDVQERVRLYFSDKRSDEGEQNEDTSTPTNPDHSPSTT